MLVQSMSLRGGVDEVDEGREQSIFSLHDLRCLLQLLPSEEGLCLQFQGRSPFSLTGCTHGHAENESPGSFGRLLGRTNGDDAGARANQADAGGVVLSEPTVNPEPEPEPGLNVSQFYAINGHIFKDFRIGDDMTLSRKAVRESSAIFKKKDVPLAYKCSNIRERGFPEYTLGNLIALHCSGRNWRIYQSKGARGTGPPGRVISSDRREMRCHLWPLPHDTGSFRAFDVAAIAITTPRRPHDRPGPTASNCIGIAAATDNFACIAPILSECWSSRNTQHTHRK
ncbi:uncharacterized protein PG986_010511 [Apiospora aurea]|uniref:Uncharacterized protein n=1 Tax=Apiospora aurea TaxID=335848 RepID=A0ABR1Q2G5_9PEZI